jgi:hypothetical protein
LCKKDWDPDAYEEEQYQRMRAARLDRKVYDRRWNAKWAEECARPIGERQYFNGAEITQRLACDPHKLVVDPELEGRIGRDLVICVQERQFAVGEVATLSGGPPDFEPLQLTPGEYFFADAVALFFTRGACRRYIEARRALPGAPGLLRDWFGAGGDTTLSQPTAADDSERTLPPSRLAPFWSEAEGMILGWLDENGRPARGDGQQAELERWTAERLEGRGWEASRRRSAGTSVPASSAIR